MWGFKTDEQRERIYSKLDKIEEKMDRRLEKIEHRLDSTEKHLAVYNEQLTIHIQGVEETKKQNELLKQYMDKELAPIRDHVVTVKKFASFVTQAGGLLLFVLAVAKYLGWI